MGEFQEVEIWFENTENGFNNPQAINQFYLNRQFNIPGLKGSRGIMRIHKGRPFQMGRGGCGILLLLLIYTPYPLFTNYLLTNKNSYPQNQARTLWQTNSQQKKCLICYKIGYWSTKHPQDERIRAKNQYFSHYFYSGNEPIIIKYIAFLINRKGTENGHYLKNNDDPSHW